MTADNWIHLGAALLAAFVAGIGWFVTAFYQRRKDVAQRRLEL